MKQTAVEGKSQTGFIFCQQVEFQVHQGSRVRKEEKRKKKDLYGML